MGVFAGGACAASAQNRHPGRRRRCSAGAGQHTLDVVFNVLTIGVRDVLQEVTEQVLAARFRFAKAAARGGAAEAAAKRAVLRKDMQKDRQWDALK